MNIILKRAAMLTIPAFLLSMIPAAPALAPQVFAAVPVPDPCAKLIPSTGSVTNRQLANYSACRFDRLEGGVPTPTPTPTLTPTPTPTPTPTRSPTPTPTPSGSVPTGVTFSPVAKYPSGSAFDDPNVFPIGVWLESVVEQADVNADKAAGLNTYYALTSNSNLPLVASNGMFSVTQQDEWQSQNPSRHSGWLIGDEIDMQTDPSVGPGLLSSIISGLPKDGKPRATNYGKGVSFWETDAQASAYVNLSGLDIASNDVYWFTDNNVCGQWEGGALLAGGTRSLTSAECHRAANYGAVVDRMRALDRLDGKTKPIWNVVEIGHPFSESDWPSIEPDQIKAAVWHSIIAGAQGIVYFNHSFGGPCPTQHALRESCYADTRTVVTQVNQQIQQLAPVLNSPTAYGYVSVSGGGLKTMTKNYNGSWYVFTGSDGSTGSRTFTLPADTTATTVQVLGENRTLPISNRQFTDNYTTANTIHLYKIG